MRGLWVALAIVFDRNLFALVCRRERLLRGQCCASHSHVIFLPSLKLLTEDMLTDERENKACGPSSLPSRLVGNK